MATTAKVTTTPSLKIDLNWDDTNEDNYKAITLTYGNESARMNWCENEYPSCCSLFVLENICFRTGGPYEANYSQNRPDMWQRNGKKFFDLVNKDPDTFYKTIQGKCRSEWGSDGGFTLTLTERATDKPIVNEVIKLLEYMYNTKIQRTFSVKSNHANYPVSQFVGIMKPYTTPKRQQQEAV